MGNTSQADLVNDRSDMKPRRLDALLGGLEDCNRSPSSPALFPTRAKGSKLACATIPRCDVGEEVGGGERAIADVELPKVRGDRMRHVISDCDRGVT